MFCKNCFEKQQDIGEKDQTMAYKKQEQYDIYEKQNVNAPLFLAGMKRYPLNW
jgi:hypothetical protein